MLAIKLHLCMFLVLPEIITSVVNKMQITRDKEWFPLEYVFIVVCSNLVDVLVGQLLIKLEGLKLIFIIFFFHILYTNMIQHFKEFVLVSYGIYKVKPTLRFYANTFLQRTMYMYCNSKCYYLECYTFWRKKVNIIQSKDFVSLDFSKVILF